jgi:hypothetical protein
MQLSLVFDVAFVGIAAGLAALVPAFIVMAAIREKTDRTPWIELLAWVGVLFGWFALALFLTRPEIFGAERGPINRLAFPLSFAGAIVIGSLLIGLHPSVRARVVSMPLQWPVALQSARVVGGCFIVWAAFGKADWTFALIAGLGDIVVGVTAPFAARAVARGDKAGRRWAFAHAMLGLGDFALAIGTAITTGARTGWPGQLIPVFLVPLAILMHIWLLTALWRTRRSARRGR